MLIRRYDDQKVRREPYVECQEGQGLIARLQQRSSLWVPGTKI